MRTENCEPVRDIGISQGRTEKFKAAERVTDLSSIPRNMQPSNSVSEGSANRTLSVTFEYYYSHSIKHASLRLVACFVQSICITQVMVG